MDQSPDARSLASIRLIASQLEPVDDGLPQFYGRLSRTAANLIGAGRAAFFLLEGETLSIQQETYGIDAALAEELRGIPCRRGGDSAAERIVFGDQTLRAGALADNADLAPYRQWLNAIGARDGVAVPWATGTARLGLVVAYDSSASGGFSDSDVWVLQVAAAAAALVWQQRELATRLVSSKAEETDRMRTIAERMGELEEMKRQILNLAAHELRGPLAVIRGYVSMLADGSLDGTSLRRVLPILSAKTSQMDALVTQMLEVARLEEGRLDLDTEVVDLSAVCRETVDVAGLLAAPGITVFLGLPPKPVRVVGDQRRIATIVNNLIDNGMKYSPNGGVVHCQVVTDAERAYVTIRDDGLGIAERDLPNLFTRFGRIVTPENSHISGTGLGLHLSRELARMQGGDLTVESRAGVGSTFTLSLPLAPAEPGPTAG